MSIGLSVARIIAATWSISSAGASYANFNTLLILGDSAVINTTERYRTYTSLSAVAQDFGGTSPEYLAAQLFFAQKPTPQLLYIGRWARTATSGQLVGATLTTAQQALSNFTSVASGGFKITVNGGASTNVAAINLSGAANLSAVASLISAALTTASLAVACTWTGSKFVFTSTTTGTTSAVSFLTAPTSGTDISTLLGGASTSSGAYIVAGVAAETALASVQAFDDLPFFFYGLTFAASTMPAVSDYQAVAAYVEGTNHLFGITTADTGAITAGNTSDIGYLLEQAAYQRTFGFYSTSSPYAVSGAFGSFMTTNMTGQNTMFNLMWKVVIGLTPELLKDSQASVLDGKRYNYYATYDNQASIITNGWCFGNAYVDEVYGADWQANRIATDLFNLFTSQVKVPQTDAGMNQIKNTTEASLNVGVTNGLIGQQLTWNGPTIGALNNGDILAKGYYVYMPKISSQSSADRAARKAPLMQIPVTLSGAVNAASAAIQIQR